MLHEIERQIDGIIARHQGQARALVDLSLARLPEYFPAQLLRSTSVVTVPTIPKPHMPAPLPPALQDFAHMTPCGITYKNTYFVLEDHQHRESLHFHELIHVIQWAYFGAQGFLQRYMQDIAQNGYANSRLEEMAYRHQAAFEANAPIYPVYDCVREELKNLPL